MRRQLLFEPEPALAWMCFFQGRGGLAFQFTALRVGSRTTRERLFNSATPTSPPSWARGWPSAMSAIHKLEAVKEQLVASCESLATLSMQHQQWQRSVEQMLADVQASLTIPDLSESEPRGQKKLSHSGSMSMPSVHSRKSAALHPLLQRLACMQVPRHAPATLT